ncbi:hypothetical protein DPMN_034197 [Dreissena polymorpha]|uniref:Uncharacterized protein n=1 Tax=Dreissena polymorpha TaxID=45954 RepID=A0A9D4RKP3_DREPO|nr:hypothetical protein DPMN_034197 [Dreissena polymorpha]
MCLIERQLWVSLNADGQPKRNIHAELSFLIIPHNLIQLCWFPSNLCAEIVEKADDAMENADDKN